MLLRIKIHKWNEFQEQFNLSLWHQEKLLFLTKASPREHSSGQILTISTLIILILSAPLNNWQRYCHNKNGPMDLPYCPLFKVSPV